MTAPAERAATPADEPIATETCASRPSPAVGPAGGPEDPAVAFLVVAAGARPAPFRVNGSAFDEWCDSKGEELGFDVPDWHRDYPGLAFSDLIADAIASGVIEGSPGLDLVVFGDDDSDSSGYYVTLANATGRQRRIRLTSGWNELELARELTDARVVAREHVDTVCVIANGVIDGMAPQLVTGAPAGNMVSIEMSEGSCATWVLSDEQADAVMASIEALFGPPASLRC